MYTHIYIYTYWYNVYIHLIIYIYICIYTMYVNLYGIWIIFALYGYLLNMTIAPWMDWSTAHGKVSWENPSSFTSDAKTVSRSSIFASGPVPSVAGETVGMSSWPVVDASCDVFSNFQTWDCKKRTRSDTVHPWMKQTNMQHMPTYCGTSDPFFPTS